jgi:putative secretion ATPase (PEP-CTERM system associated)
MYSKYYGFKDLPFQLSPDSRFFYSSSGHEKALAYLRYGVEQGEGFIVITGEIGAGKTTLVEHVLSTLDHRRFVAARVVTTQLNADDLLRTVASAFGVTQEGLDKASLLRRLEGFLRQTHHQNKRSLLLIDEAQNLAVGPLEELRMLSNFSMGPRPLLQSFLLGQPQFRATISRPELEQLRQRVIASYHLGPMSGEETRAYIEHRLRTVGWSNDPRISDEAFRRIHEHTDGVPRRINTLCSRLLLFGFLEERHIIDGDVVQAVWRDLSGELPLDLAPPLLNGTGRPAVPADAEVGDRLEALERQVSAHDRTIRQAMGLAAKYLERSSL